MTSPYVEDLLKRIKAYIEADRKAGADGRTYHPNHPVTLLAEAKVVIETDERILLDLGKGEFIR